jgi:hypothetical protein
MLPKGSKVCYDDCLPFLGSFVDALEAFGTVGVGHVWHATFVPLFGTSCYVTLFLLTIC